MYYQGEVEKNDRRKIITVATAIVVVVLILVVSIIVVAAKKSGGNNVATTETTSSIVEEQPKEEPKPETTAPVETVTVSTKPAAPAEPVPDTGPEDTIPMIMSFGSLTTAGTAYLMSLKKRA